MPRTGEHEIEPHPRGAWRAFVAGCVAVGLLLLGLIAGARAGTVGSMAEVRHHAAALGRDAGPSGPGRHLSRLG